MPLKLSQAHMLATAQWLTFLIPIACSVSRFAADLFMILAAVLFLVHSIAERRTDWLGERWVQIALILWAYVVARAFFAEDVEGSLGRAAGWIRFPIFAAALSFWILQDARAFKRLIISLSIAVGFMLADTAMQYFVGFELLGREPIPAEGSPRLTGPFSAPRIGIMLIWMAIPAIAYWLMDEEGKTRTGKPLIIGGLFAVGLLTVIFMSGERMAFLLTGLAFVIAFFLLPISKRLMLALGLLASLAVGVIAHTNQGLIERQIGSTSNVVGTFSGSDYGQIWQSATSIITQHPIAGVGLRQFRVVCPKDRYGAADTVEVRCNLHPHNMYLEWMVESGIIGLGLFMAIIVLWWKKIIGAFSNLRTHPVFLGLIITLVIRLWPLASTTSFFTAWSAVPMWLMVGWLLAMIHHHHRKGAS